MDAVSSSSSAEMEEEQCREQIGISDFCHEGVDWNYGPDGIDIWSIIPIHCIICDGSSMYQRNAQQFGT